MIFHGYVEFPTRTLWILNNYELAFHFVPYGPPLDWMQIIFAGSPIFGNIPIRIPMHQPQQTKQLHFFDTTYYNISLAISLSTTSH